MSNYKSNVGIQGKILALVFVGLILFIMVSTLIQVFDFTFFQAFFIIISVWLLYVAYLREELVTVLFNALSFFLGLITFFVFSPIFLDIFIKNYVEVVDYIP